MAARQDETGIDRLFQLPIEEFTAARNALAKQAGSGAAAIRQLSKPPLAAWAVNQLYWQQRDTYDALISASEALRRTHKAVLGGRSGDLRAAGREHDQALDRALKATMAIVTGAGHPATDTTRQAVISTLRALPADEPPGRLTRTLQPGGFEMLAGFSLGATRVAVAAKPVARVPERHDKEPKGKPSKAEQARHAKELARAKQGASAAAQALQRAEHDAKREEFERARAAREADKATAAVERARAALDEAQQELEEAERAAKAALANQQRAERRASEADASLETARQNAEAARSALAQLER
jgi:hypothetical protein